MKNTSPKKEAKIKASNKNAKKMNFKERRYTIEDYQEAIKRAKQSIETHNNRIKTMQKALDELVKLEKAEAHEGAKEWIASRLKAIAEED